MAANEADRSPRRSQRTVRLLDGRVDGRVAVAVAVGLGGVAVGAGASPTGSTAIDIVVVWAAAAAVIWASASAPWWAVSGAAGVGASIALGPAVAIAGAVAFAAGLYVGITRRERSWLCAVIGGVAVNVLIRSQLEGFFGLSAVIGISVCAALLVVGIAHRPPAIRRRSWAVAAGVAAIALVGIVSSATAAARARADLQRSVSAAEAGIDALDDGEYSKASELFRDAALGFERAGERLDGPLAMPTRLVPGVAQNVGAGADLAGGAADALQTAADSLGRMDIEAVRFRGGAIDVDAVRALEAPLVDVAAALDDLQAVAERTRSPWLLPPIEDRVEELRTELRENGNRLATAIDSVRLAPGLLGSTKPRTYVVLFTTPAEVRGLGGFVGAIAEVEIDGGRITLAEYRRTLEMQRFLERNPASCAACPVEFLQHYGRFGFSNYRVGSVAPRAWSDVTMAAHFPDVARVAQVLYPQSGARPIDGVIVMDPYVVAGLMEYTGPIEVPELDVVVDASNAADFILFDQYVLAEAQGVRVEALETLGQGAITSMLASALPPPAELARRFAPLVDERRLLMWTADEDEQALLDEVGLLGAIPPLDPDDGGFSVSVTNGGNSKIDVFLDRESTVSIEESDGRRRLVARVTLTNGAPATGLPSYVIGNGRGLPSGASRLYVTFYGPDALDSVERDGRPIRLERFTEAGWGAFSEYVEIPAGGSVSYRVAFDLPPADPIGGPPSPTIWEQPLAQR